MIFAIWQTPCFIERFGPLKSLKSHQIIKSHFYVFFGLLRLHKLSLATVKLLLSLMSLPRGNVPNVSAR